MPVSATITVLVENSVTRAGLRAEHGLSFWLDLGTACVLFDTGQSGLLLDNARALGIELDAVDAIALSHGHYDHVGGLAQVLALANRPPAVHLHPLALKPKYHRAADSDMRDIGFPEVCRTALERDRDIRLSAGLVELAPGLFLTGEIPRTHPEENAETGFFLDANGCHPDPLADDQSLFLDTSAGTVVLLGCAHAGIINTLEHIQRLTRGRHFRAVLGGTHLNGASADRLDWTLERLTSLSIPILAPGHCTGAKAVAALWAAFPGRCLSCATGTTLTF